MTSIPNRAARHGWSRRRKILVGLGGTIAFALLAIAGFYGYLAFSEWRNPSVRVYVDVNGRRTWLEQPFALVTPRAAATPSLAQVGPGPATSATPAATATPLPVPLPPLRLNIPKIGVDVPVVLSDNAHLPRQPLAGWFFKSAFPGTAGNTVLLGHLDGPAAIFGRLRELRPGDQVRIQTQRETHVYVVDSSTTVPDTAVEVLAPTPESTVTLITCAGDWDPVAHTYHQRLVVRAHYAAVEPLPAHH